MATVNGYTAERIQQIEDQAIIGGEVVDDDLILERYNGVNFNAGRVRGFPGITDMALYDPIGVPKPFMLVTVPLGYGLCEADTEYDAATYPILAAEFGTGGACINGACSSGKFRLPNLRGRILVGQDTSLAAFNLLHETGGSKDAVIVNHMHPAMSEQTAHTHTAEQAAHTHDADQAAHSHAIDGDFGARVVVTATSTHSVQLTSEPGSSQQVSYSDLDYADPAITIGSTDPSITVDSTDPLITTTISNPTGGVAGTDKNLPPYRVIKWIMRLG